MKRMLLILLFAAVAVLSVSAAATTLDNDSIYLFGILGDKTSLSLVLDKNSTTESSGYSFLMTDPEVQYSNNITNMTGKRIASWYLVSNTNDITVRVNHTRLESEIDSSVQLDYMLSLQYSRESPYNMNIRSDETGTINFSEDNCYKDRSTVDISHYGLFIRLTEPFDLGNPGGYYCSTITMSVASNS